MAEILPTSDSGLPQGSPQDEIQNNIDILMAGSGALQPRSLKYPEAQGSDAGAFQAREEQLFRAAKRLVELAGEPDRELADDLKRLSGLNLPDSVRRELEPVLAKIQSAQPPVNEDQARSVRESAAQKALE